jgi:hypothetical protein
MHTVAFGTFQPTDEKYSQFLEMNRARNAGISADCG